MYLFNVSFSYCTNEMPYSYLESEIVTKSSEDLKLASCFSKIKECLLCCRYENEKAHQFTKNLPTDNIAEPSLKETCFSHS